MMYVVIKYSRPRPEDDPVAEVIFRGTRWQSFQFLAKLEVTDPYASYDIAREAL